MSRLLLLTCAFALFASPAFADDADKVDNLHGPDQGIANEMGYKTMANGDVLYEEVAPAAGTQNLPLEDIAPAAGPADAPAAKPSNAAPSFHYDPLTQTYRRVTVDKDGNTRHDVINTAR